MAEPGQPDAVVGRRLLGAVLLLACACVTTVGWQADHPIGSAEPQFASPPTRWILDGPRYRSDAHVAAAADQVVVGRVASELAAGAEGRLLGGNSPLPIRIWLVRTTKGAGNGPGPPGGVIGVAMPDDRYVRGTGITRLRPGMRGSFAVRCDGHHLGGVAVCATVGASQGITAVNRTRRRD